MTVSVLGTGGDCVLTTFQLNLFRWHPGFRCLLFSICFSSLAESKFKFAVLQLAIECHPIKITFNSLPPPKVTLAPSNLWENSVTSSLLKGCVVFHHNCRTFVSFLQVTFPVFLVILFIADSEGCILFTVSCPGLIDDGVFQFG